MWQVGRGTFTLVDEAMARKGKDLMISSSKDQGGTASFKPEIRQYKLEKDSKKNWMGIKGDNRGIYAYKMCEHTDFLCLPLMYVPFCISFSLSPFILFNTLCDALLLSLKPFLTFLFP